MQTVKAGLKKTYGNLEDRLSCFLATYRVTPQSTTGEAPASLIFQTRPRSRLDILRPSLEKKVLQRQEYDIQTHDRHSQSRIFHAGDSVWAVNFQGTPKWMAGVLEGWLGPLTFTVRLPDGRLWRRHQDHLRHRRPDERSEPDKMSEPTIAAPAVPPTPVAPPHVPAAPPPVPATPQAVGAPESVPHDATPIATLPRPAASPPVLRRSNRVSKPPDRLNL